MKRYTKTIDGKQVIKPANKIVINKDGMNIFNPKEEMIFADGWVEYVTPEPTEDELFRQTLTRKLNEINNYDSSKYVNTCIISCDGVQMNYWANKTERSALKTAVEDCLKVGRESYRLDIRELSLSLQIPCERLLTMLSELEVYAIDCYNKTSDHIFEVKKLSTIEEIEHYDYRQGYPEKLIFEIS
jgi:hypothetical protein